MKHNCGHDVETMGIAVPGGWSELPMRCLECFAEWVKEGRCCKCGAEAAPGRRLTITGTENGEDFTEHSHYCEKHWLDVIRPERCGACGRFVGKDGDCVHVGEEPETYDPYWGPNPPEPIFEWRCGPCLREHEISEGE